MAWIILNLIVYMDEESNLYSLLPSAFIDCLLTLILLFLHYGIILTKVRCFKRKHRVAHVASMRVMRRVRERNIRHWERQFGLRRKLVDARKEKRGAWKVK